MFESSTLACFLEFTLKYLGSHWGTFFLWAYFAAANEIQKY